MGQRKNLLVLSAIVSGSAAILPLTAAEDSLPSQRKASHQQDLVGMASPAHTHLRYSKSKPKLPGWAHDPLLAGLDRNLHSDRFAQLLNIKHTPPQATLSNERPSEIIEDEDDDDEVRPHSTGPHHQPVPTKWLMLGYSRVVDIPTSTPAETRARGYQAHGRVRNPADTLTDLSTEGLGAHWATAQPSQRDRMQSQQVQVLGALTVFVMVVLIIEGLRYLWRVFTRRRMTVDRRSQVALEGDEKQLRAIAEITEQYRRSPPQT